MAEVPASRRPALVVLGIGGNALATRGQPLDDATQRLAVAAAARQVAPIVRDRAAVVTHGSGPQVGGLVDAMGATAAIGTIEGAAGTGRAALDVIDAEAAGMIGYLLEQALRNQLAGRAIATLLTQVDVDPADEAFDHPTKPIGRRDHGLHGRRLVPSPRPQAIVEMSTIEMLVDAGVLVVCGGGGGIPVAVDSSGARHGVDAVIDKDLTTALLAIGLGAGSLLLLTDVDGVYEGWGKSGLRRLHQVRAADLRVGAFEAGSMGPKVDAACWFVEATGATAHVGALADAVAVADGTSGTTIVP